ncbi:WYL domain-containing protein [Klugiella xanthotipulae]|uniref:Putative DNA-binding transcriptional regulator YafY n=1 Tax=Klugiella xanthotipulae TaxID=244735 RepID=A0A543HY25_9MICO|nr:WYL domain-containing protein [Klugiella xanthotipulae]TQM63254.1 putative DNA-binding transcriptional regulator YafY [Klugiella xanthotipulae]
MTGFSESMVSMRSDRLVAILLMLQRRDVVTAPEVAKELEVSERTARRDLDALSMAGIPLYSVRGRHGGWRLLGGGRTDLSGLTAGEARALFLVSGSAAATTPAVKDALRKLVRALPEPFRDEAEAAASAQVVDPHPWGSSRVDQSPPDFLDALYDAVILGTQVRLGYISSAGIETDRIVHPLGVVAKGLFWYLVAHTDAGRRTFRIDRVSAVMPTEEPVQRPLDFDLAEAWHQIADTIDRRRAPVEVHATCAPEGIGFLRTAVGRDLEVGNADADGRIPVVIHGHSEYGLAGHISGLVEWLDVTGPHGVRNHLATIGTALAERYSPRGRFDDE